MINTKENYDGFIFTHIPKCGGTSFRNYINRAARDSNVSRKSRYIPGENWLSVEKDYHRISSEKQAQLGKKRLKIIAMHVAFDWHRTAAAYLHNPFYYVILRDPVERVLSHYEFFNKRWGRQGVRNLNIESLNAEKREKVLITSANLSIVYLTGMGINGARVTKEMKNLALLNLQHNYGAYGLLEDLETSINLLRRSKPEWLKLPDHLSHKNKTKSKGSSDSNVSPDILQQIKKLNELEIDFYKEVQELFYQRSST